MTGQTATDGPEPTRQPHRARNSGNGHSEQGHSGRRSPARSASDALHSGASRLLASGSSGESDKGQDSDPVDQIGTDLECLAALDLGTNNCRLLIARRQGNGFHVLDAFSRIVRLGEGLAGTGMLSEAAMQRTIEALQVCASKMRRWNVQRARCVATEACRRAGNCDEFIRRVREETGILIEIISSEEEAFLALAGCAPLLSTDRDRALVFDIGGGSTEISWLEVRKGGGPRSLDWISLPMGVVTLTEQFGGDRIPGNVYDRIVDMVIDGLDDFEDRNNIRDLVDEGRVQMLGTSGTVTTLAGLHLDLPRYNRARVDGAVLDFDRVDELSNRLAKLDYQARAAYPCIGRDRADLVVSGCAILTAIREIWPVGSLRVADRGVREGILMALVENPGLGRLDEQGSEDSYPSRRPRRRSRRGGRRRRRAGAVADSSSPVSP